MPETELILWSQIRRKQVAGCRFRRQYGVGPYVLDFYCPELHLAIEVDGDSHFNKKSEEYDRNRQNNIEQYGIKFLRFTNEDIRKGLHVILDVITKTAEELRKTNSDHFVTMDVIHQNISPR